MAYVSNDDHLLTVDLSTHKIVRAIKNVSSAASTALSPDGATLYTVTTAGQFLTIDAATGKVSASLAVSGYSSYLALAPDGGRAYISGGTGARTVTVVNTATDTVVATIPVSFSPGVMAVTADGRHVYITSPYASSIGVLDTVTDTVAMIAVAWEPQQVVLSADGTQAFVTCADSVAVISTARGSVTAEIGISGDAYTHPAPVSLSPNGALAYLPNTTSNTVSVIDTVSHTVTATVTVGTRPSSVTFGPSGAVAFVTNTSDGTLTVVDTASAKATATIADAVDGPTIVAVTPDGRKLYVGGTASSSIRVIDTATHKIIGAPVEVGDIRRRSCSPPMARRPWSPRNIRAGSRSSTPLPGRSPRPSLWTCPSRWWFPRTARPPMCSTSGGGCWWSTSALTPRRAASR
ncbi:hypothetical protein ACFQ9X_09990 [Catenulispora yoronensis]